MQIVIGIKTLQEDRCLHRKDLAFGHGLSFYIEVGVHKILFDTGTGDIVVRNAEKMNVVLSEIDHVILSHNHYDHAGGYVALVKGGLKARLTTGKGFWDEKYKATNNSYTYLGSGLNQHVITEKDIPISVCDSSTMLFEGCFAVSQFSREQSFEMIPDCYIRRREYQMIPDDFSDEISLVIETKDGLVVIVGCSHPGIINILSTIRTQFQRPIVAVFGGIHLVHAPKEQIIKTKEALIKLGVKIVGLNHCAGEDALEAFRTSEEFTFVEMTTGSCYFMEC